jgi:quinoprotein glucose dehydrogenase
MTLATRLAFAACAALALAPPPSAAQTSAGAREWPAYAHDAGGSKYSPAAQITPGNVARLVPLWTYRTGDFGLGRTQARDETTPLYVDGVLYASTPFGGVRALDGATGRELWAFDAELDLGGDYGDFTNRGVSTWLDPARGPRESCRRRIYVAPVDARLIALDARTGLPCADFGEHGQIHLDRGILNAPDYHSEYSITSPPAVIGGLVIAGSAIADNHRAAAPSGVVRAFDARTGALVWAWDPIPREPTAPGFDTWRGPTAHQTGAANAWSIISVDSARGLVFIPVGSASPDFYGGERLGANLYANSVVALRAATGAVVWHFQVVHHDLWDYDVPAQPALFTLHRGGRDIPALAQATKMGHLFVLNRETGEPLFPVEERAVPASDVPGEEAWPTQPFPVRPLPLVPSRLVPEDAFGITDSSRAWCRGRIASLRSEGIFTPPSVRGSVLFPGNIGGSNWSGISIDPARHLAFVPTNRVATFVELIPRAQYHAEMTRSGRDYEMAPQAGTAFAMMRRTPLAAPDGVPCNAPPYGTLSAVDLVTGDLKWEVPLGRIERFAAIPGSERWGSPSLGGTMATGGGVVFAGGALDRKLHAFDAQTGAELWSWEFAAGVHAAPMTYVTPAGLHVRRAGRQLVVVAAGGHRDLHTRTGDYIVAFALPDGAASATEAAPAAAVRPVPGHYEGRMLLDVTRYHASFDLTVTGDSAALALNIHELSATGTGRGRVVGDSLVLDVDWRYPAHDCGGTMHLAGVTANGGVALEGEIDYVDGCNRNERKGGTFALWRGPRVTTSLSP